jgi:hypothetical protein
MTRRDLSARRQAFKYVEMIEALPRRCETP